MIRANIWLAITNMCGPAPITTLARSVRPAWPSPCPGTPEKHSSAGGRLTSACSKHALNTDMENSPSLWHMPPTNLAENDKKADFYALLQDVTGSNSPLDITIVLSDTNAALSRDACTNWPDVVGTTFADRTTNDNGDRLLSFCRSTYLFIADSWFPRKQIHHWTWYSNDGFTKKAIDHIIISRRWLRCVTQCRVFRGAQLGNTDHRLLCANIQLKLKAPPGSRQQHQPDISRLADPSTKLQYQCEISNRYDALAESTDQWEDFKNTITACATKCLGRRRPRPKKPWITPATFDIIESRRSARLHGDLTEYRSLNSARNASIKNDRALACSFLAGKGNHPGRGCYP